MFTGIVEEVGRLQAVEPRGAAMRLRVKGAKAADGLREGDSVAVSGVCLTAIDVRSDSFAADVSPETLAKTSLGSLGVNADVNLERALRAGDRLGGHIVQGHVDGVGRLLGLDELGDGNWTLRVQAPPEMAKYLVYKGSISVEGISLTLAAVEGAEFSVAVIPHTYANTNLRAKRPGDPLNLETDVIAKYVEKMLASVELPKPKLTVDKLRDEGF